MRVPKERAGDALGVVGEEGKVGLWRWTRVDGVDIAGETDDGLIEQLRCIDFSSCDSDEPVCDLDRVLGCPREEEQLTEGWPKRRLIWRLKSSDARELDLHRLQRRSILRGGLDGNSFDGGNEVGCRPCRWRAHRSHDRGQIQEGQLGGSGEEGSMLDVPFECWAAGVGGRAGSCRVEAVGVGDERGEESRNP